ncbi:AraC family transcriptional regulator [uncultured Massilia sp.]|uniref:AraC family transcriptional regulator n=1 Tax=uncultured Massilia sp. TaxID=169973 RepID=UPI002582917B|nr:AraC family transcriptional regulator [uncultured Massilia sp.]
MTPDLVSELLDLMNARSVLSGGLLAGGAWAIRFPASTQLKFWGIQRGRAWIVFENRPPLRVEAGDVFLFHGAGPHVLASDLDAAPVPLAKVAAVRRRAMNRHGNGEEFLMFGGKVGLDAGCEPLLFAGLPPLVHLPGQEARTRSIHWVLERLVQERDAALPGWEQACVQLAHLMFIGILRAWLADRDTPGHGLLRAASDARLAPALRLMHGAPGRAWRLAELAQAAAMSRASFAERFKRVAGTSPLHYLTELRMRLAQKQLRSSRDSLAQLAETFGYASESAFSNAFKRVLGQSPKHFRDAQGESLR